MLNHATIDHETRRLAVELLTQLLGDDTGSQRIRPLSMQESAGRLFTFGEFTFDPKFRRVTQSRTVIALTLREYELLAALASRSGAPVSKTTLRAEVWGNRIPADSRSIDQHVAELRRKLRTANGECALQTIRKYGYALIGEWVERPETTRLD